MITKKMFKIIALLQLLSAPLLMAQVSWVKHTTPVLRRSGIFANWKGLATTDAFVMADNDTLKMWYGGSGWLTSTDDCPHVRIGYAWSLNGINWNEYPGNPVLDVSADTSKFDSDGIETPTVIKDLSAPQNQRYKLWYAGRKTRCKPINDHKFGFAYSPDGIKWTKYTGNPVLIPGNSSDWYNTFISSPSVMMENGSYKMWFTAPDLILNNQPTDGKGNIGYATSTDGVNWVVYPVPVLIAGEQANWDAASIAEPSVIKIGATYHLFYSALDQWTIENFQVGYASSKDGITWIKATQNPVLKIGGAGQWDRYWASHPGVIYDNSANKFKMWYTGRDTAKIVSLAGYYWDIGYAESTHVLAVDEVNTREKITDIYPNPAHTDLNIELPNDVKGIDIEIYTQLGKLVKKNSSNKNSIKVTIEDLQNGLYFILIHSDGYMLTNSKFVVNRQ
jgi:hypothetical protein